MRSLFPIIIIVIIQSFCYAQQRETVPLIFQNYVNSLCELSEAYYYDGKIDEAVEIIESNLNHIINTSPEIKSIVLAQYSKVLYYKHSVQGKSYDLPIEKIKEAISLAEKTSNLSLLADLKDLMGLALYSRAFSTGEFNLAKPFYDQALRLREQFSDSRGVAETIFHLGLLKEYSENSKSQAMDYYKQGYRLAEKEGHKAELSYLSRHIGAIYLEEEKLDSAEYYLTQSLNLRKEIGLNLFIAPSLSALAEVMKQKKHFDKASFYLLEAIQFANQTNAYRFQISALLSLGDLEFETKNIGEAMKRYNEALVLAKSTGYSGGEKSAEEKINLLKK